MITTDKKVVQALVIPNNHQLSRSSNKSFGIFISGVGGQGLIYMAGILTDLISPFFPKVISTEDRGVAKTRGSISAQIKMGEDIYCGELGLNTTNIYAALELQEALRHSHLIGTGSSCIILDTVVSSHNQDPIEKENLLKKLKNIIQERSASLYVLSLEKKPENSENIQPKLSSFIMAGAIISMLLPVATYDDVKNQLTKLVKNDAYDAFCFGLRMLS